MSAMLEVHKLTAGYRRPVIRDISFTLRPGEVTAVLGRNGCGKTTLLRSLTGGARILSGAVQAMGEDCLAWSARRRARTIALLSQHSQLLPGLRAEEVIAMGRTPWLGPLSGLGPEERAMVRAAAERFGVAELLGRDCAQLSEGQRQLVHLARLAVQDAPILLLDEPNSALDFDNTSLLFHRLPGTGGDWGADRSDRPPRPGSGPALVRPAAPAGRGEAGGGCRHRRNGTGGPSGCPGSAVPHNPGPPG